jgi:hypothetical protein
VFDSSKVRVVQNRGHSRLRDLSVRSPPGGVAGSFKPAFRHLPMRLSGIVEHRGLPIRAADGHDHLLGQIGGRLPSIGKNSGPVAGRSPIVITLPSSMGWVMPPALTAAVPTCESNTLGHQHAVFIRITEPNVVFDGRSIDNPGILGMTGRNDPDFAWYTATL